MTSIASDEDFLLSPHQEVIVSTKYGRIAGLEFDFTEFNQTANVFLGVPFAQPPVGQLRFKKTQPLKAWEGIRMAKKFPPQCTQPFLSIFENLCGTWNTSEDCLYLNIFAPSQKDDPKKSLLPVIVFIHGGAFVLGGGEVARIQGVCELILEQQIVFVSIQYRLAFLGFFSNGDDACDDNCGLWVNEDRGNKFMVRENIAEFGGDCENITVMGASAGGVAADLLSLSPHSRDLFHKIILMGGIGNCEWALDDNVVEKCRKLSHKLLLHDCSGEENSEKLINKLRELAPENFGLNFFHVDDLPYFGAFRCPIAPRIDGKFLPKSLEELRKEAPIKPRLVGVSQMEGAGFMFYHPEPTVSRLEGMVAHKIPIEKFPDKFEKLHTAALEMFLSKREVTTEEINLAAAKAMSDSFSGIALQDYLMEQAARGNAKNIFLYTLDYVNPEFLVAEDGNALPVKAPMHYNEMYYFARGMDLNLVGQNYWDANDEKLQKIETKMWCNFAKYGDPNGNLEEPKSLLNGFKWESLNAQNPTNYLSLKPEPEMKDNFQDGRPMRWIRLMKGEL